MTMPNFMILGAAKAGTTSLHAYLNQHPQIFLSPLKEPNFFAYGDAPSPALQGPGADLIRRNAVMTQDRYERLFDGVAQEIAIGEASVTNLWPRACERIKAYAPSARLIAILRQPTDRAYSHFLHNRKLGVEPLTDFAAALADEDNRLRRNWPPPLCYRFMSHYAADLQNYLVLFPREQLRIYLYDDFVAQPLSMLQEMYGFLGVDASFASDLRVRYNTARVPRHQGLLLFLFRPHWAKTLLKPFLPASLRRRLTHKVQSYNWEKPEPLSPQLRHELTLSFTDEITHLQTLLGRNLSHWLTPSTLQNGERLPTVGSR
jgi:hypothetical protein